MRACRGGPPTSPNPRPMMHFTGGSRPRLRAGSMLCLLASTASFVLPQRCSHAAASSRQLAPRMSEAAGDEADEGSWRVDKARLDEQWSKNIRKRRTRFLPFEAARQWARAMHLETEEEWREWIRDGEKRNPYVPSKPDEVYQETGWAGWHDFLNGPIEDLSTVLKPGYKRGVWLRGPLSDMPNT